MADSPSPPPASRTPSPSDWLLRLIPDPPEWLLRMGRSLSIPGLLVATLFFAASLSPSLLPRGFVLQGIVSGLSLSAGYALGTSWRWLWGYLELPLPEHRTQRALLWGTAAACGLVALVFLWQASGWQNGIRALMEMEPVDTARPWSVGSIALVVFLVLLGLGRLFLFLSRLLSRRLKRGMPRRVANVLGLTLAAALFWSAADGLLFRQLITTADQSFQQLDAAREATDQPPANPLRTGSSASLVSWEDLGRTGRDFVAATPTATELEAFRAPAAPGTADPTPEPDTSTPLPEPVRVYVGLNAADSPEERAELALAELLRADAFQRSLLVLVTPTGTGWIDPAALTPLEYLHRGDVASVAVQYSYLPSWLTLLVDADYGAATARALFQAVYGHWTTLPEDDRPELYLHGLSLGALNSERSADLWDVLGDPFQGALWSGPPFRSSTWSELVAQREPDSPEWLPRFRDGSVVRFMNQDGFSPGEMAPWGPMRIVYLQYASDPITFVGEDVLWQRPGWLEEPRGPDVSPDLWWFPLVTLLQLTADLAVADQAPTGYGHVFAVEHYIDAWLEITAPEGWPTAEVARLKEALADVK